MLKVLFGETFLKCVILQPRFSIQWMFVLFAVLCRMVATVQFNPFCSCKKRPQVNQWLNLRGEQSGREKLYSGRSCCKACQQQVHFVATKPWLPSASAQLSIEIQHGKLVSVKFLWNTQEVLGQNLWISTSKSGVGAFFYCGDKAEIEGISVLFANNFFWLWRWSNVPLCQVILQTLVLLSISMNLLGFFFLSGGSLKLTLKRFTPFTSSGWQPLLAKVSLEYETRRVVFQLRAVANSWETINTDSRGALWPTMPLCH